MGPLPGYFPYFIASCKKNPSVRFVIVNDSIDKSILIENVQYIKMSMNELSTVFSEKLSAEFSLTNAWKINEFKPCFGLVFNDLLVNYDFWGWCDIDIIWGNLRTFLTENLLTDYDVITSKLNWTAGHFTLFRNTQSINSLFLNNPKVIALLQSPIYYAFEESCQRWQGKLFSLETLIDNNMPVSMFDIVKNADKEGKIKAFFKDLIREHPQPINYIYEDGKLTDLENREEFMYYHLITVKKIWRFFIPAYTDIPTRFFITPPGIISEKDRQFSMIWKLRMAYSCAQGIWKSVKKQTLREFFSKVGKELSVIGNEKSPSLPAQ